MKAQILCRLGKGTHQSFRVQGQETVIGREVGLGVSIPVDGVSRRHARILFDGKSYWVEDLKSTNGTLVGGQLVKKEKLYHLDVISLGKKIDLVFVLRPEGGPEAVKRRGIVRAALGLPNPDAPPYELKPGEIVIGRSHVCNIVAEASAVSKMHVRVIRTVDQLVVEDLNSSNGTFVNGSAVRTSVLRDGDVLSLAGVEVYRVSMELGEITSSSGVREVPEIVAPAPQERPRYSAEWRTRFEWDSAEYRAISDLQQEISARDAGTVVRRPGAAADDAGATAPRPQAPPPPKSPAAPPRPATPVKPAVPKPEAPKPEAPKPAPPKPAPPKPAPKAAVPEPPPPKPAAAPPPAPPVESAPKPAPPVAPAPKPAPLVGGIAEVHLSGSGFDLMIAQPGAHILGRAKDAQLKVENNTVSRRHARVILSEDRGMAYLQDMGGSNGTYLNGAVISDVRPLAEGDRIGLGEVTLNVRLVKR